MLACMHVWFWASRLPLLQPQASCCFDIALLTTYTLQVHSARGPSCCSGSLPACGNMFNQVLGHDGDPVSDKQLHAQLTVTKCCSSAGVLS